MPQAADAYQSGIEALRQKHYERAIAHLQRCYELCEQSGDRGSRLYSQAQMGLVKCYRATDQRDQAIALCRKLSRSPNPNVKSWAKRMLAKLTSDETQLTDLERLYKHGVQAFQRKQYGEAIEHLQKFDKLCRQRQETQSTAYANAQMGLVKCYRATNQLEAAILLCRQLLSINHPTITPWAQKTLGGLEAQIDEHLPSTEFLPASGTNLKDSTPSTMIISPEAFLSAESDTAAVDLEPPEASIFADEDEDRAAGEAATEFMPHWADTDHEDDTFPLQMEETEELETPGRAAAIATEPAPQLPEDVLEAGLAASRQRAYPEAIAHLSEYLRTMPSETSHQFVQAQMALVRAYVATGQIKAAIAQCKSCEHTKDIALKSWVNKTLGDLLDPDVVDEREATRRSTASERFPRGIAAKDKSLLTQSAAVVGTYKPTSRTPRKTKPKPRKATQLSLPEIGLLAGAFGGAVLMSQSLTTPIATVGLVGWLVLGGAIAVGCFLPLLLTTVLAPVIRESTVLKNIFVWLILAMFVGIYLVTNDVAPMLWIGSTGLILGAIATSLISWVSRKTHSEKLSDPKPLRTTVAIALGTTLPLLSIL